MKISSLLALPLLLVIGSVNAVPYNSNVLIERGIDPHIINLAVTTFRQQIAYKIEIEYKKNIDGVDSVQEFNLLYDPFASYGIDVRIQVPKADMEKYDEGDIKEEIVATLDLDGDGTIDTVRVGLASDKWAGLIGVEKGFNRHWNGSSMYSNGSDRSSLNMMVGYRF